MRRLAVLVLTGCALLGCAEAPAPRAEAVSSPDTASVDVGGALTEAAAGQLLYVPAYSHVYFGDRQRPVDLATTLSVRNADPGTPIRIVRIQYVGSDGETIRPYLDAPRLLRPLATLDVVVDQGDRSGGSGASFLVEWTADGPVAPPVVEAVMISTSGQQGISFVTEGRVITEAGGRP